MNVFEYFEVYHTNVFNYNIERKNPQKLSYRYFS